jgi:hypothetical protein
MSASALRSLVGRLAGYRLVLWIHFRLIVSRREHTNMIDDCLQTLRDFHMLRIKVQQNVALKGRQGESGSS